MLLTNLLLQVVSNEHLVLKHFKIYVVFVFGWVELVKQKVNVNISPRDQLVMCLSYLDILRKSDNWPSTVITWNLGHYFPLILSQMLGQLKLLDVLFALHASRHYFSLPLVANSGTWDGCWVMKSNLIFCNIVKIWMISEVGLGYCMIGFSIIIFSSSTMRSIIVTRFFYFTFANSCASLISNALENFSFKSYRSSFLVRDFLVYSKYEYVRHISLYKWNDFCKKKKKLKKTHYMIYIMCSGHIKKSLFYKTSIHLQVLCQIEIYI